MTTNFQEAVTYMVVVDRVIGKFVVEERFQPLETVTMSVVVNRDVEVIVGRVVSPGLDVDAVVVPSPPVTVMVVVEVDADGGGALVGVGVGPQVCVSPEVGVVLGTTTESEQTVVVTGVKITLVTVE